MTRRRIAALLVAAALGVTVIGTGVVLMRPATPTVAAAAPHFVDETSAAGVALTYDGEYPYAVGGGVAVFDCEGDGRPDLYLAGGSGPAILYRNESSIGGALRFAAVHNPATDSPGVTGAYPVDVDGDGIVDVAVLRNGENLLLHGLGGCRFERGNEKWGFDGGDLFTTAFSATWEPQATLPTLAFGNYIVDANNPDPARLCADNQLVRPDGGGRRYGTSIPLSPSWCAQSMLFSDWDRSGRRDLRVSNDRQYYSELSDGQEQLWQIVPGQPPRLYTATDGWVAMRIWGMGIASQDVTGDGLPDVYLTSQGDNKLQTLTSGPGQPTFRDIAVRRGVIATRPFTGGDKLPSTAWHPEFADVNDDGFSDLFVSKGNVGEQAGYATRDPSDLFLGQPDGTFVEAADRAGILSFERGRGAALVDLNLDGLLDLVEVNFGADAIVWRNVGRGTVDAPAAMGHWLQLAIEDPGSPNRNAIGAKLEARIGELMAYRELTIGGGHAGGQLGWLHLGLGPANRASLRVTWPDGDAGPWLEVAADQFAIVRRGATEAEPWTPG